MQFSSRSGGNHAEIFLEDPIDPSLDRLVLRGDSYHHIRDVLRLRVGDRVTVCDGALNDMICLIDHFLPDGLVLR